MYPDAPWLEYGFDEPYTPLAFSLPVPPWNPDDDGIGGSDESAAGIPESFEIRNDYIREVRLPFFESQLAIVETWFRWARTSAQPFNFKFRGTDVTARRVYFHGPKLGAGGFKPERDNQFKGLFWLTVKLRTEDGLPFVGAYTVY